MVVTPEQYTLSFDVRDAELFAHDLAVARSSSQISLEDLLGGLFISSFERLSPFWDDWQAFEELVMKRSGIERQRLHYWFRYYKLLEAAPKPHRLWRKRFITFYPWRKKGTLRWKGYTLSQDVLRIYHAALRIATASQPKQTSSPPTINSLHVLLALAKEQESDLCELLRNSGIHTDKLEQSIRRSGGDVKAD